MITSWIFQNVLDTKFPVKVFRTFDGYLCLFRYYSADRRNDFINCRHEGFGRCFDGTVFRLNFHLAPIWKLRGSFHYKRRGTRPRPRPLSFAKLVAVRETTSLAQFRIYRHSQDCWPSGNYPRRKRKSSNGGPGLSRPPYLGSVT